MSYFVAVQKSDGLIDVVNFDSIDSTMQKYESLYVPTYFFDFSDGLKSVQMTEFCARTYCRLKNCRVTSSTKMTKTRFGAEYHGYHPGLGCETRGKEHVNALMKERGLVEIGDSALPTQKQAKLNPITDDVMRDFVQSGAQVSSREAAALIDGTYSDGKTN